MKADIQDKPEASNTRRERHPTAEPEWRFRSFPNFNLKSQISTRAMEICWREDADFPSRGKITKRTHALSAPVQSFEFKVQSFEICETKPCARRAIPSSRFKEFKVAWKITKRTHCARRDSSRFRGQGSKFEVLRISGVAAELPNEPIPGPWSWEKGDWIVTMIFTKRTHRPSGFQISRFQVADHPQGVMNPRYCVLPNEPVRSARRFKVPGSRFEVGSASDFRGCGRITKRTHSPGVLVPSPRFRRSTLPKIQNEAIWEVRPMTARSPKQTHAQSSI